MKKLVSIGIVSTLMVVSTQLSADILINENGIKMPGIEVSADGVKMPGITVTADKIKVPGVVIDSSSTTTHKIKSNTHSNHVEHVSVTHHKVGQKYINKDLSRGDFRNQDFSNAIFKNVDASRADFSNSNLTGAIFINSDLTRANFSGANLAYTKFQSVKMKRANMQNSCLAYANIIDSDLTRVVMDQAILIETKFSNNILKRVSKDGAIDHGIAYCAQSSHSRAIIIDSYKISSALSHKGSIDLTINFEYNSDVIKSDAKVQLFEIAQALKSSKLANIDIQIEGHTDSIGSDKYNLDLSYKRAFAVMQVLVQKYNIDSKRLAIKGFGESKPIASNSDPLGRSLNRRVTLVKLGV